MRMYLDTLTAHLLEQSKRLGNGRLTVTIEAQSNGGARLYCTHWTRLNRFGCEDCKAVAFGTLGEVLEGIEHYVATYSPHGPREMEPGDLGLVPVANTMPAAAE